MAYAFNNGKGFLSTATAIGTASYLFTTSGYLNDTIRICIDDSGDRILSDGGTIEAYECVDAVTDALVATFSPSFAFNTLYESAIADGAITEAVECFEGNYIELENIEIL